MSNSTSPTPTAPIELLGASIVKVLEVNSEVSAPDVSVILPTEIRVMSLLVAVITPFKTISPEVVVEREILDDVPLALLTLLTVSVPVSTVKVRSPVYPPVPSILIAYPKV